MKGGAIARAQRHMGYRLAPVERCCATCQHRQARDAAHPFFAGWSLHCTKGGFGVSPRYVCDEFKPADVADTQEIQS